jgi:putative ABC transport system permease protein
MKPVVTPLPELITGDARASLWAAAAAVGFLLLIACVNVANLLLIRGSARTRELAVRSALGAGRHRLIRQLLTESGVLALLGGALGVLLSFAAVRVLAALAPPELPRREMIEVDARVLLFALGVTAAAALLSGLLPAVLTATADLAGWLRGGGREERLLVVQTSLAADPAPERARELAMLEEMLARVTAIPGVVSAASLPSRPFSGEAGWMAPYTGEGQTPEAQAANPMLNLESVGPEYFRTLQLPIRRGRAFEARDREDAPRVAIVSEAVARHTWPGEDPLGKRIKLGPLDSRGEWHSVVGVVGETRYRELADPQPSIYLPTRQFGPMPTNVAVRTRADPAGVIPQIRVALQQVHPDWMLVGGGSVRQLRAAPLARPRFTPSCSARWPPSRCCSPPWGSTARWRPPCASAPARSASDSRSARPCRRCAPSCCARGWGWPSGGAHWESSARSWGRGRSAACCSGSAPPIRRPSRRSWRSSSQPRRWAAISPPGVPAA